MDIKKLLRKAFKEGYFEGQNAHIFQTPSEAFEQYWESIERDIVRQDSEFISGLINVPESVGQYKTVSDVVSDLNVIIVEAPIPSEISCKIADIVGELEETQE